MEYKRVAIHKALGRGLNLYIAVLVRKITLNPNHILTPSKTACRKLLKVIHGLGRVVGNIGLRRGKSVSGILVYLALISSIDKFDKLGNSKKRKNSDDREYYYQLYQ